MLYIILSITRIVLRGYYKKIFVHGQQNIPKDKPVILAVNHPSAFTEPCIVATHLDRELHFLIRGDIINPKVKWFFDGTHQVPIYRFRDGFSSMRQNEKQFSYCFDLLAESGCIVIFAEGSTKHIKQTRPIQKGAARIAFGAIQNRDLEDVLIIPVGVNFEFSPRPRSIVAVEIGEPISARSFYASNDDEQRKGLGELSRAIFDGLKPRMVHIEDNDRLEVADDLLLYASHDRPYKSYPVAEYGEGAFFKLQKNIANTINQMPDASWTALKEIHGSYQQKLKSADLTDQGPHPIHKIAPLWLLATPLAILGWIFLGPVYWISFNIQGRLNQKNEYISGFRMAGFLLFVPVFIVLWMLILRSWMGWWVLILPVVLPILSMFAVWWLDAFNQWKNGRNWKRLPQEERQELLNLRQQLMKTVL